MMSRVWGRSSIAVLGLFLGGCALRFNSISPSLPPNTTHPSHSAPMAYTLVYDPPSYAWTYDVNDTMHVHGSPRPWVPKERAKWSKLVAEVCVAAGYSPAEVDLKRQPTGTGNTGTYLVARVTCGKDTYGSAATYITGLTLGLIPSWESWQSYTVNTTLYLDGVSVHDESHAVMSRDVAHLLILPFFWLNFVLPSERDRIKEIIRCALSSAQVGDDGR
jgi:hypothetical protein